MATGLVKTEIKMATEAPSLFGSQFGLIPNFSGEDDISVATFFSKLQLVSHFSQWSEAQTLGAAQLCLSGAAAYYVANNPHIISSFAEFKKCMTERFSPKVARVSLEKLISTCSQEERETVAAFSTRLRSLGRQLLETHEGTAPELKLMHKFMEDRLVAQFLAGLRPDLARFVAVRDPKNLIDAEKFARLEESASVIRRQTNSELNWVGESRQVRSGAGEDIGIRETGSNCQQTHSCCEMRVEQEVAKREKHRRQEPSGNVHAQQSRVGQTFQREIRCFNCNKMGHLARYCRQKNVQCFNCGEVGHIGKNCPLLLCGICKKGGHRPVECRQRNSQAGNE